MLKQLVGFAFVLSMVLPFSSRGQTAIFPWTEKPIPGYCIDNYMKPFGNWDKSFHRHLPNIEVEDIDLLSDEMNKITNLTGTELPKLYLFLSTLYAPVCNNATIKLDEPLVQIMPPCRAVCRLAVKEFDKETSRLMKTHKKQIFKPFPFNCDLFPRPKDVNKFCVPAPVSTLL